MSYSYRHAVQLSDSRELVLFVSYDRGTLIRTAGFTDCQNFMNERYTLPHDPQMNVPAFVYNEVMMLASDLGADFRFIVQELVALTQNDFAIKSKIKESK